MKLNPARWLVALAALALAALACTTVDDILDFELPDPEGLATDAFGTFPPPLTTASPVAPLTTSTPVALGSRVPPCPTWRSSKRFRSIATTSWLVTPLGLSTTAMPCVIAGFLRRAI